MKSGEPRAKWKLEGLFGSASGSCDHWSAPDEGQARRETSGGKVGLSAATAQSFGRLSVRDLKEVVRLLEAFPGFSSLGVKPGRRGSLQ